MLPQPPSLDRELNLVCYVNPLELPASIESYFIVICPRFSHLESQNLWMKTQSIHSERRTKLCSPIPHGPNYSVIQESFSCTVQVGVKGFSVFEMVYVNVAFIETSWDVIIVLLSTYEQQTALVSPSPSGVGINANQLTQGNKPLVHTLLERFTYIDRQTDKLSSLS